MKIAISGAGVAGPTLAYWLERFGHEPVLIEKAPAPRKGGYIIDFWGAGYDVAERMGILPELRALGYQVQEIRFVDEDDRVAGEFPADVFGLVAKGRMTSLQRSDLAAAIYRAVEGRVETRFGEEVTGIEEHAGHVRVSFEHSAPQDFDLVVGADGLHSRVRSLAFGRREESELYLGYKVAAFETRGYRPRDELVYVSYAEPGRQVSRFSMRGDRTLFLLVYRDRDGGAAPSDDAARRALLRREFSGMGWEMARILEAMGDAPEIYFDRVSQIRMPGWTKGRVALIGDAAACVSLLAGEGCGLAMAEAYVLAGEIARTPDDHAAAFGRYEGLMRPFLAEKQESARKFASSFVPGSRFGIILRNWVARLMTIPMVANYFTGGLNDNIDLPRYAEPGPQALPISTPAPKTSAPPSTT
jgi:2-polyprenyl-6-methoxyphenol hydroxylase-like FAD-dependent oxidoreductase